MGYAHIINASIKAVGKMSIIQIVVEEVSFTLVKVVLHSSINSQDTVTYKSLVLIIAAPLNG